MPPDLTRLKRELREESCPQRVLDEVKRQVSVAKPSRRWSRYAVPAACAALILLGCLSAWRWHAVRDIRERTRLAEFNTRERVRVANQAEDALGLVGSILLNAGAHSEKIISDRTVPRLRDSLETTKNKIIQHIEL